MLPESLPCLLREHRDAFAPQFASNGNSDHAPMASLALAELGADMDAIRRFAAGHRNALSPIVAADTVVTVANWETHLGKTSSYAALLVFFDSHIAKHGWPATVAYFLPRLISGWVRGAFHPMIRLGYGVASELPSEIAAGLAYMTVSGDDPALARLAQAAPMALDGNDYLAAWQAHRRKEYGQGGFGARYAQVVRDVPLRAARPGAPDAWRALSAAGLQVFHATHDFFALHMVTGSHAWRVCAPFAGDDAPAIGSVGLACAYLAIGAPDLAPLPATAADLPLNALRNATDAHDIKIAHSCMEQARAFDDLRYVSVAAAYLAPRLQAPAGHG